MRYVARLAAVAPVLAAACGNAHLDPRPLERHFAFELEAELPASANGAATLWVPVPVAESWQELGRLQVRASGGTPLERYDAKGNRMLSVAGKPPLRIRYSVPVTRFRAARPRENLEQGELPAESPWLVPAARAPLARVRRRALTLTAHETSILGKVRILYDNVVRNVRYAKPAGGGWGEGDLDWVCDHNLGNCSDFHTLFIAYCQSLGIPAYFEIGYSLPVQPVTEWHELQGYHCWARAYVPGMSWLPVDASQAKKHPELHDFYFGGLTENRVRLSRGRDIRLNPPQHGAPLNFFVWPYAEQGDHDVTPSLVVRLRVRDMAEL